MLNHPLAQSQHQARALAAQQRKFFKKPKLRTPHCKQRTGASLKLFQHRKHGVKRVPLLMGDLPVRAGKYRLYVGPNLHG